MKNLTDEEYDALDEYYTKNPPDVDPRKNKFLAKDAPQKVIVDDFSVNWLMSKTIETKKSTAEIINDLIQKEIAASN